MKELLSQLGIDTIGYYSSRGNYIIEVDDDRQFGRLYSLLDKSDLVEESEDDSLITQYNSSQVFISTDGKYQLTLLSDFDTDKYQLVVREIKG